MQNEPKQFEMFSTGYKQLKRSIFGIPVIAFIIMYLGIFIDSFVLEMLVIAVLLPISIIMTIVDYRRLVKKNIEKPNRGLLFGLLAILVVTLLICILCSIFF